MTSDITPNLLGAFALFLTDQILAAGRKVSRLSPSACAAVVTLGPYPGTNHRTAGTRPRTDAFGRRSPRGGHHLGRAGQAQAGQGPPGRRAAAHRQRARLTCEDCQGTLRQVPQTVPGHVAPESGSQTHDFRSIYFEQLRLLVSTRFPLLSSAIQILHIRHKPAHIGGDEIV
jgi:hypothetical protein